jgi:phospholipid/cholesterol/gamma-HCH transport system permease protein
MEPTQPAASESGALELERSAGDTLLLRFSGAWTMRGPRPGIDAVEPALAEGRIRRVAFDTAGLATWDSAILTFLTRILELCKARQIDADRSGLPEGVQRLLDLAEAVPEKQGARGGDAEAPLLARIGDAAVEIARDLGEFLAFIGSAAIASAGLLRLHVRFRFSDLLVYIQDCGVSALPIVTLICFLLGLILAFMGAVQLQQFGAAIYVADLVALAMAREMGAVMTGVIMSGRTGAAFAAQLGTMKVTEEIDALTTMGISPMEFLVLPRMIALFIMMPLLCIYADVVGILGGAVVGIGMLDLAPVEYYRQTIDALTFTQVALGIVKAAIFGLLIALSGCLRGIQCGNSASAVGDAATSAVVTSIVFLIVTDGLFAVICNVLKI